MSAPHRGNVERAIATLLATMDMVALPEALQTVAVVFCTQSLLDGGGLAMLFGTELPGQPTYETVAACYRRIGVEHVAKVIEDAAMRFPFAHPERHAHKRRRALARRFAAEFEPLDTGGREVWTALRHYVDANHAELGLPAPSAAKPKVGARAKAKAQPKTKRARPLARKRAR